MEKIASRKLSFKVGFLSKLAKDGVLPSRLFERVKEAGAADPLMKFMGGVYGEGRGVAGAAASQALPAAKLLGTLGILAPIGAGAVTGTTAAKLSSPPAPDIEALRKEELAQLYRRLAKEIRARRRV